MIRGTNAQFKFKLPYKYYELSMVQITFWQSNNNGPSIDRPLPIVKILEQCSPSNIANELWVTLNQEETLRFEDDRKAYVQLRGTTVDGIPFASKQQTVTVYPIYDDSILDDVTPTPTPTPTPNPDSDNWIMLDGSSIA